MSLPLPGGKEAHKRQRNHGAREGKGQREASRGPQILPARFSSDRRRAAALSALEAPVDPQAHGMFAPLKHRMPAGLVWHRALTPHNAAAEDRNRGPNRAMAGWVMRSAPAVFSSIPSAVP